MGKRMVFMGAGAIGGYVGGHLARGGEDVTLIDPWPEHNGLVVEKGEEVGIPAPTHAALTRLVKQVERGEIEAHQRNIEGL